MVARSSLPARPHPPRSSRDSDSKTTSPLGRKAAPPKELGLQVGPCRAPGGRAGGGRSPPRVLSWACHHVPPPQNLSFARPQETQQGPRAPPLPRSTDQLQLAPFLAPPRTPFSGRTDREFRTPCPLFPKCVPTHRAEPSLGQGTSARHPLAQSPSSPHQRDERGQRRKPHRGRSKPGDPRHGDSRPPLAAGCLYSLSAGPRTPGEGQGQ